ncbi:MAG: D-alanine--D-alanine ligase [Deltaproteobacteria bacterium]|nr:D-alanine--D-alanine ligase [Deltaproteobacteria bacterium]
MIDPGHATRPERIAVVHNVDYRGAPAGDDALPSAAADADVEEVAEAVVDALRSLGHDARVLTVDDDPAPLIAQARAERVTCVFNLVESLGRDASREAEFVAALEAAGIPYTGNRAPALRVAQAKDRVREVLDAADVPHARGLAVDAPPDQPALDAAGLGWPLFVKPARVDGSIGIDQGSVVYDLPALQARVERLLAHLGGPCLVEDFLPGPELNVAILGDPNGPVAVTTIDFGEAAGLGIVTYDCKWTPGTPDYDARSVPATGRFSEALLDQARSSARRAFLAIGGTSYGRVDLRLSAAGLPSVIDVNPNPDLHPDAGLAIAARDAGLDYPSLVERILRRAGLEAPHGHSRHPID